MLGPVVACIAVFTRDLRSRGASSRPEKSRVFEALPWFIIGFFLLATFRSLSLVPDAAIFPLQKTANILTILSMAALGLGVDLRVVNRVGARVTAAVTLSLLFLLIVSLCLVRYMTPA